MQILRVFITVTLSVQVVQFGDACEGENCDNDPSQEKLNTPLYTFNVLNHLNSGKKRSNPAFTGLTDANKVNRNCCQNGGTCFLGTFCICPKHFTGRHCEYDTRIRSCGTIRHGEWIQEGCQLCQCIYGTLKCSPQALKHECDAAS
ncbi:cryptic protein-like [Rhineura floridana]|uniref:cryptic protein-like n=1 Tax=Rhineura floridana TaxID=261503 RepID=UPI002AC8882E|nr:cryptic protein-like [Rhineura floridana]